MEGKGGRQQALRLSRVISAMRIIPACTVESRSCACVYTYLWMYRPLQGRDIYPHDISDTQSTVIIYTRHKGDASHIIDTVWLYRSPMPWWGGGGYFTCSNYFYLPMRRLEGGGSAPCGQTLLPPTLASQHEQNDLSAPLATSIFPVSFVMPIPVLRIGY
jgi:hypothetical protein